MFILRIGKSSLLKSKQLSILLQEGLQGRQTMKDALYGESFGGYVGAVIRDICYGGVRGIWKIISSFDIINSEAFKNF